MVLKFLLSFFFFILPLQMSLADMKKVDDLISQQKIAEALKEVRELLPKAKSEKDEVKWAKLISKEASLQIALHGYETAVKDLSAHNWPQSGLAQAMTKLMYGGALQSYVASYSWEIRSREKVESKGKLDLKTWTAEEIQQEIQRAFADVWANRKNLGKHKKDALKEVLVPNTYPDEIRGTLRDSFTYLYMDTLANSASWSPREMNETYVPNVEDLIKKSNLKDKSLKDPEVHPLEKLAYVAHDLVEWHRESDRGEAALEAKLELLRKFHANFTDQASRSAIKEHLQKVLIQEKNNPWISMAHATLADFIQQESTHDALMRARELGMKGQVLFPKSLGAARCRDIVRQIESPEFSMEAMAVDAPSKESISINYKNFRKIYFRSFAYDVKNFLIKSKDWSLRPGWQELKDIKSRRPQYEWSLDLPDTIDYRQHRVLVTPPFHKPGFYVILASVKPDFPESENIVRGVQAFVSDLVLSVSENSSMNKIEVSVLSGATGSPLSGVDISVYKVNYQTGHELLGQEKTNKEGRTELQRKTKGTGSFFVIAEKDDQLVASQHPLSFYSHARSQKQYGTFIYTDRSIYRPGQKILWKIVNYSGDREKGKFTTNPGNKITVQLHDANYQMVQKQEVTTNEFGSASGEFVVPEGKLLGQWSLATIQGGNSQIRVEEYKRPTFEVELANSSSPLRLNQEAKVEGGAKYYFGAPLAKASVKWRIYRRSILPWWCFWGGWDWGFSSGDQLIDQGATTTKQDGSFSIKFKPKADERLTGSKQGITYNYEVKVDVTDEGEETRSSTRNYLIGFTTANATIQSEAKFYSEDARPDMKIKRTDLNGNPQPGDGTWKLYLLKAPVTTLGPAEQPMPSELRELTTTFFTTRDDGKLTRWNHRYNPYQVLKEWESEKVVAEGKTANESTSSVELPSLKAAAYRLSYTTKDAFGSKVETQTEFLVANKSSIFNLPGFFTVESNSVKVGGKIRILTFSGNKNQLMILETHKDGQIIRRQTLITGKDPSVIEIPVHEEDRGGMAFTLRLVHDHQEIKITEHIMVPWDNKEMKVEFASFRNKIRPGSKETWTLKLTGPLGKELGSRNAEILAYMYDRSLDAFAPHYPPLPSSAYPTHFTVAQIQTELGIAPPAYVSTGGLSYHPEFPYLSTDHLFFLDSYGIGGPGGRGMRFMSKGMPGVVAESKMAMADAPAAPQAKSNEVDAPSERAEAPAPAVEMRSNFSETAFWKPHLLIDKKGQFQLEFTVPDSVTAWQVWAHAITQDLSSGSVKNESKSVKELMIRPYLPRFLREGDEAEIKVVINSASQQDLSGSLDLDIIEEQTGKSVRDDFKLSLKDRSFKVKSQGSTNLSFKLKAPSRVGSYSIRVSARAGNFSDGELRALPVLPGRFHLSQSRFVSLKGNEKKELKFEDLEKGDDKTQVQDALIVTLDAQLFYSVIMALPYIVEYPYESIEQTVNSFVSTGIVSSVYQKFPAIADMAKTFSKRKSPLEKWDSPDPNRKMALEESPWLIESRGGDAGENKLVNVLDPEKAGAHRNKTLQTLKNSQTSLGAFPWFPGGPPSPYITLYVLYNLSKALEFNIDVPKDMVKKAWSYMHRYYIDEIVKDYIAKDCCAEIVTFLNFILSNYPDDSWTGGVFTNDDRKKMTDFSFKHWKNHSPFMKAYLALTLSRSGRTQDAKLVWDSVMDSAKTSEDEGTHWAQEDRSWLWYNDTIETHAMALRTGSELKTKENVLEGLVQWIFLNKKLNHWKSTRATSEVIYSLTHYLQKTNQLGTKEKATVTLTGKVHEFEFSPDKYTGKKNQIVVPGEKITPDLSLITVEKETPGHMFASATWHYSTEKLPPEGKGDFMQVERSYFRRVTSKDGMKLEPLSEGSKIQVGDELEVQLSIRSKHPMEYVHVKDPRPAGMEPMENVSVHKWELGIAWYEEIRDNGTNFFIERLPQGQYTLRYRMRAFTAGDFKASPATIQPLYAPEFSAFSKGDLMKIHARD